MILSSIKQSQLQSKVNILYKVYTFPLNTFLKKIKLTKNWKKKFLKLNSRIQKKKVTRSSSRFCVASWYEVYKNFEGPFYREISGDAWNRTRASFWPGTNLFVPGFVFSRQTHWLVSFFKTDTLFGFWPSVFFRTFLWFFQNTGYLVQFSRTNLMMVQTPTENPVMVVILRKKTSVVSGVDGVSIYMRISKEDVITRQQQGCRYESLCASTQQDKERLRCSQFTTASSSSKKKVRRKLRPIRRLQTCEGGRKRQVGCVSMCAPNRKCMCNPSAAPCIYEDDTKQMDVRALSWSLAPPRRSQERTRIWVGKDRCESRRSTDGRNICRVQYARHQWRVPVPRLLGHGDMSATREVGSTWKSESGAWPSHPLMSELSAELFAQKEIDAFRLSEALIEWL